MNTISNTILELIISVPILAILTIFYQYSRYMIPHMMLPISDIINHWLIPISIHVPITGTLIKSASILILHPSLGGIIVALTPSYFLRKRKLVM